MLCSDDGNRCGDKGSSDECVSFLDCGGCACRDSLYYAHGILSGSPQIQGSAEEAGQT